MNGFWHVYELFICVIDIALIHIFLSKICRVECRFGRALFILGVATASFLTFILSFSMSFSVMKVILSLLISYSYVLVIYKGGIWKKTLYYILVFAILGLSDLVASLFFKNADLVLSQNIYSACFSLSSKAVSLLFCILLMHFKIREVNVLPRKYKGIFLLVFFIGIVTAFLLLNSIYGNNNQHTFDNSLAIVLTILLSSFTIFYYLFNQMCLSYIEKKELEKQGVQVELLLDTSLRQEKSMVEILRLSHDMKYFMTEIKRKIEDGNIDNALDIINKYGLKTLVIPGLNAGHPTATAYISRACEEARNNGIAFRLDGYFEEALMIESLDLGLLLGNILDNALEATMKATTSMEREIIVRIKRDSQLLILDVENTYDVEPIRESAGFRTSKEDKANHGIGILSINNVVNKYNGEITFTHENGRFRVLAVLPVYEEYNLCNP